VPDYTTRIPYSIQPTPRAANSSYGDFGLGGSVILKLLSHLPDSIHFHLYFYNLFTSVTLLDKLTNIGIGDTVIIRANRLMKCPLSDLAKSKRGAYDYAFDSSNHVVLVRWMDSKPATIVYNCNGVLHMMKARRWSNATKSKV